jgi:peptidoglycan hydrolase-like protein with peptidoglycan-binding domain
MLLAGKVAWSGIILVLLAAGISGPRPSPLPVTTSGDERVPAAAPENEVKKTQQALRDRKHYRGTVDGSFGLRTRAGIRSYQKAESLPITGQIDSQTAAALGVRPESTGTNVQGGREVSHSGKPSAGTARVERRSSRLRRQDVAPERVASGIANNPNRNTNK